MLGVVSEQFPKGGALTLNSIAAVGMLSVGVIGNPLLGNLQDREINRSLQENHPKLHARVIGEEQMSVLGEYRALDQEKMKNLGLPETVASSVGLVSTPMGKGSLIASSSLYPERQETLSAKAREIISSTQASAKKNTLLLVAILPTIMLISYILLILYFRAKGGYKAEVLTGLKAEDEKYTGGVEGAVEA